MPPAATKKVKTNFINSVALSEHCIVGGPQCFGIHIANPPPPPPKPQPPLPPPYTPRILFVYFSTLQHIYAKVLFFVFYLI